MLGIGVITYQRLPALQRTIRLLQDTICEPHYLVVADDGDCTAITDWCTANKLTVITGKNRGVCWNKNRALYSLYKYTNAQELLLLEDDCYPTKMGWDKEWCAAIRKHQHINYAHPNWPTGWCKGGRGTPEQPWLSWEITGQATGTTRSALNTVGYLNTRFQGYGYGHIEWTERFCKAGFFDRGFVPCIRCGLEMEDVTSFKNMNEVASNWKLAQELRATPFEHTLAWQNPVEQMTLMHEAASAVSRQPLIVRG